MPQLQFVYSETTLPPLARMPVSEAELKLKDDPLYLFNCCLEIEKKKKNKKKK
jgi:hypothetical protein